MAAIAVTNFSKYALVLSHPSPPQNSSTFNSIIFLTCGYYNNYMEKSGDERKVPELVVALCRIFHGFKNCTAKGSPHLFYSGHCLDPWIPIIVVVTIQCKQELHSHTKSSENTESTSNIQTLPPKATQVSPHPTQRGRHRMWIPNTRTLLQHATGSP